MTTHAHDNDLAYYGAEDNAYDEDETAFAGAEDGDVNIDVADNAGDGAEDAEDYAAVFDDVRDAYDFDDANYHVTDAFGHDDVGNAHDSFTGNRTTMSATSSLTIRTPRPPELSDPRHPDQINL
jgi:hypothetical protein